MHAGLKKEKDIFGLITKQGTFFEAMLIIFKVIQSLLSFHLKIVEPRRKRR